MIQHAPKWLERDIYVAHPTQRLIFEPVRLRLDRSRDQLMLHYTSQAAVPIAECRPAQSADLFFPETRIYIAGQHYIRQLDGDRLRLSNGTQHYLIQLHADPDIHSFAAAFDGEVINLSSDTSDWIDTVF